MCLYVLLCMCLSVYLELVLIKDAPDFETSKQNYPNKSSRKVRRFTPKINKRSNQIDKEVSHTEGLSNRFERLYLVAQKYKQNAEQKRIERIEREMEEEEKILRLNKQKVPNIINDTQPFILKLFTSL